MKFTVLGSGDTRGLPKAGCRCGTCADALRSGFERKRFGLLLEHDDGSGKSTRVLIDASPDLRRAFLQHGFSSSDLDAVLLTHEHFDHVAGLGEFFFQGKTILLYGRPDCVEHVFSQHAFGYLQSFGMFDLRKTEFFTPFFVGPIRVTPLPVEHSVETQGFLFEAEGKRAAVLTDCRANVSDKTQDAVRGVDLLFTDGWLENQEQFEQACLAFAAYLPAERLAELLKTKKRNHLLIAEAASLAEKLEAEKTVLLHVAHDAPPHEELARKYDSDRLQIGWDGMVCTV